LREVTGALIGGKGAGTIGVGKRGKRGRKNYVRPLESPWVEKFGGPSPPQFTRKEAGREGKRTGEEGARESRGKG